eukprot:1159449-Pelagomonas_calceolata.AAC.3
MKTWSMAKWIGGHEVAFSFGKRSRSSFLTSEVRVKESAAKCKADKWLIGYHRLGQQDKLQAKAIQLHPLVAGWKLEKEDEVRQRVIALTCLI